MLLCAVINGRIEKVSERLAKLEGAYELERFIWSERQCHRETESDSE
jgi:hypothetical protein